MCESIHNVDTFLFYSCVRCSKRVQFREAGMLKCGHCGSYFFEKNSQKQTTARVSLKKNDEMFCYKLFPPAMEAMVKKYNENKGADEVLDQLDEEKLCEIILLSENFKLTVDKSNYIMFVFCNTVPRC